MELSIDSPLGPLAAYAVAPERGEPGPGLIVIHDILGFTADTRRHVHRAADAGYAAIAPDLYSGGSKVACVVKTLLSYRRGSGRGHEVLDAAHRHLAARDDVDENRIGVLGFCMGGGFTVQYAARADVRAAAPFYGDVPASADDVAAICPVVGSWGARDPIFARQGERLVSHLEELGVEHDIVIYPDVGHSFMNDHGSGPMATLGRVGPLRAEYDPTTEAHAWDRVLRFFDEHL